MKLQCSQLIRGKKRFRTCRCA